MNQDEAWLLTEKYGGERTEAFTADCARLASGEPLAYVIGHVPFLHCTIHLDSRPLIPRPETEFWVDHAIRTIRSDGPSHPRILDLCAGSGAIGVAVGHEVPTALVTLAELDGQHLPTILKNMHTNGIDATRYHVVQSDLFAQVTETFDFILTNPPYIDPTLDRTEASVRDYEPHLALYGGEAGMALIATIIAQAPAHLSASGQLWLEHEPEQVTAIATLAGAAGFVATTHTDQYGAYRYSILVLQ